MKVLITAIFAAISFTAFSQVVPRPSNPKVGADRKIRDLQKQIQFSDAVKDSLYNAFYTQECLRDSIKMYISTNPVKTQQFQNLFIQSNNRIDSILTPEQKARFKQWKTIKKTN